MGEGAVDSLNKTFPVNEPSVQQDGHCSVAASPVPDADMVSVPFAHLAQEQLSELQRHLRQGGPHLQPASLLLCC